MATPKSNAQMWKEFGAWLRAEDVKSGPDREGGRSKVAGTRRAGLIGKYAGKEGPKTEAPSKPVRPGRLAPENGITQGKSPVGQKPYVKVGRQKPPSISGEGRSYAPRKTNDATPNSLKRNRK
jgi:hypothetical protein